MRQRAFNCPISSVCAGVVILVGSLDVTEARELKFYGALTTDYVYRGVSRSDGHGAAQLGVDLSSEIGLFGGVWASTTDIDTANRNRPREVDFYVGFVKHFGNDWSATVSINRYTFPGQTGNVDYDYEEFSALVGYQDRVWIQLDRTNSLSGHGTSANNVEIVGSWPFADSVSVTAGVGYFDVSESADRGYAYWQLGISRPLGWASIDLRYHDTSNVPARISLDSLADPRIVLAISAAF